MKFLSGKFLILVLLFAQPIAMADAPISATATHSITVKFANLRNSKGNVGLIIFNTEKGFPDVVKHAHATGLVNLSSASAEFTFDNLPKGNYAIAILHDENANDKADRNFIGIPTEGFGFSNNPTIVFGPPSFSEAKFKVDEDKTIKIALKYF